MKSDDNQMQDRRYPVEEDLALQRKIWRFERIGWYALVVIVALTLCGLFSHGPLSTTTAVSTSKDLVVEYERFHRNGGVNTMVIHSHGEPGRPQTVVIGEAMMKGFSIDSMQPQPLSSAASEKGLRLTLASDDDGGSTLYLAWRSDGTGLYTSRISVQGGGEVSLTQFIYP